MSNNSLGNNKLSIAPVRTTNQQVRPKKKVLVWSDCVLATTGFGTVARYILRALHNTGKYEIDQLAINYVGDFYDKDEVPYCIIPAKLGNAADPYGNQMFVNALQKKEYDIVFIINDTFVVEEVARNIERIRENKRKSGHKDFNLVYYYPVDCRLLPHMSTMLQVADRAVAYTNFAKESTLLVGKKPTDVIYHGTDVKSFFPLEDMERKYARKRFLNIDSDDKFVLINVNRNSLRKDIARSILAYSEFRKKVPNSIYYIHAKIEDGVGGHPVDLKMPLQELGLDITKDVIFPNKFNVAKGFPIQVLNQIYGCGDLFFTTHLGEGFGLTIIEAMTCGIPVVGPNNTAMPEILGTDRGYVYECKEKVFIDNSGFRGVGRMEDILEQLFLCYEDWKTGNERRKDTIGRARDFALKHSWDNICKHWVKLFSELPDKKNRTTVNLEGERV